MHFCKANDGVCGEEFSLARLTADEQRIQDELNTVFSHLSDNTEPVPTIDRAEALKAIEDRMKMLTELMKRM